MQLPLHIVAISVLAASMGCLTPFPAGYAAAAGTGSPPLAWDCAQAHDAAFHVVCKPSCSAAVAHTASAQSANDSDRAATLAVWGQPTVFRSTRRATPVLDTGDGDAIATDCIHSNHATNHAVAPTARPAPHLVPIAERQSAEIFTGKPWKVPLYTRPTDPVSVTRLLREVLCGSTACVVQYGPGQPASVARF